MIKIVNLKFIAALLELLVTAGRIIIKTTAIILALFAILWGLPTTWGTLKIDIFPVSVYLK